MRLILSQYLRTLKERDEFDRLLPDLLLAMGYMPQAKPQTGVRQYGVDLVAVGISPLDGVEEMLLFVIKRGDIGRRDWDNGEPTSVRPSINEALDLYVPKLIAPEHSGLRKTIVLATTGDLKQDIEPVWNSFREQNATKACFDFWGGDRVADLIERYLLNENLFAAEDRADLRKALALAGENDYDFRDVGRMILRQLGLNRDGSLATGSSDLRTLRHALRRVHLAVQIFIHWAQSEGDSRQALWASERLLLWAWHRVQLVDAEQRTKLFEEMSDLWSSYTAAAAHYFDDMSPHFHVQDGMAGYSSEGSEFAIVLFEHVGLLGSIGLACLLQAPTDEDAAAVARGNSDAIASGLCALLANNPAAASPRLDRHIVDVTLALLFLVNAGCVEQAREWLSSLAQRLDYCFRVKRKFPVSSDALEDLVSLETGEDDEAVRLALMRTSWCLATIASWCAVMGLDDHYALLARGAAESYSDVCAQLWHPRQGWAERWYLGDALDAGHSEAPYLLPSDPEELRKRMRAFLALPEYDWPKGSPSLPVGIWGLDFIACRHFRVPVPASAWYRLMPSERSGAPAEASAPPRTT
jgi:hypothetical protein